jgi:hypothetical protein
MALPAAAGSSSAGARAPSRRWHTAAHAPAQQAVSRRACTVHDLGDRLVPYERAWAWQKQQVARACASWAEPDSVFLLQHPPTYTLGAGSTVEHLKFHQSESPLPLFRVERGGEVTYHGPGQLVMYPIINLQRHRPDLHWYLRGLEEVVSRAAPIWGGGWHAAPAARAMRSGSGNLQQQQQRQQGAPPPPAGDPGAGRGIRAAGGAHTRADRRLGGRPQGGRHRRARQEVGGRAAWCTLRLPFCCWMLRACSRGHRSAAPGAAGSPASRRRRPPPPPPGAGHTPCCRAYLWLRPMVAARLLGPASPPLTDPPH